MCISEDKVYGTCKCGQVDGTIYRLATGWIIIYNCTYYCNDLYVLMLVTWGKCNGNTKYGMVFLQEAQAWTSMNAV